MKDKRFAIIREGNQIFQCYVSELRLSILRAPVVMVNYTMLLDLLLSGQWPVFSSVWRLPERQPR